MTMTIFRYAVRSLAIFVLIAGAASCASFRNDADASEAKQAAPTLTETPSGVALNAPKPGLYTAGQPAVGDWSALADAGVRTVVNLRTHAEMKERDERAEVVAAGMRYVEIPVDGPGGISSENARLLAETLANARGDVLVHCASGNRAGALLAVALAQQGMAVEDALAMGRAAGMKSTEARAIEVIGKSAGAMCEADTTKDAGASSQCAAP